MPLKKERRKGNIVKSEKKTFETKGTMTCHFITPGPKYQLKTLVGYKDHCISKYRNPAYTFGGRRVIFEVAKTPGPKYMIKEHRLKGFTFGHTVKRRDIVFGPGPKYMLPDVAHGPFYSIKWRTKFRKTSETPGPYYIKPFTDAPAFSIGLRTAAKKPQISVGPYSYSLDAVKPRAPMYTIASTRRALQLISESPGPIYAVLPPKSTRVCSFGVKHSECAPPYITKCDEQC
ncbi:outer dense fiber protein 3B isoform X1 [Mycetomoellerius zeteki]|uniref:outer dense fiber protein 3B isoform X1 n=1 Tax=Mycetomoellerius zeteki TaxID=64791 RepID=UPI00084EBD2D|nr:PREDICTED: outer dense fiber protein 3B-like isoform X1 [Trachymyrmex zeteki]